MRLSHIAMYVQDLDLVRHFYETYFSGVPNAMYHNKTTGLQTYFITFDDNTRLELMTRPGLLASDQVIGKYYMGYAHMAFQVQSMEDVDSLTSRLRADGYSVLSWPRTTGDGYYESCILDPEGNHVEIVAAQ